MLLVKLDEAPEMKKRGLKRFVCTRIWNLGDTFKLGILFEYDTIRSISNPDTI